MAKKAQHYNIKKLPFHIKPGDRVYFVLDDGRIESDIATAVGINEDGRLLIRCGKGGIEGFEEYEIGTEDRAFIAARDAEQFISDPSSIADDYGEMEYKDLDLPYYPGTDFYYCDYDGFMGRWEIFEEYYTQVFFDINGEVSVGDGESECTVIGKRIDPCFDTPRKARAYVRSQM